jgi:hypothetical protein
MLPLLLVVMSTFAQPDLDRLYDQLSRSTQASIKQTGSGFKFTRAPKHQVILFREELNWLNRGYSERQIRLISTLVLYKAIGHAERELDDIQVVDEDEWTDKQRVRAKQLQSFIASAIAYVDLEAETIKDMKSYELRFHF